MLKLLSLYLSSVTKDLQSRKNFSNLSLTDFIDIPKMVVHEQNLEFSDVFKQPKIYPLGSLAFN